MRRGAIRIYYTNETATTLQERREVIDPELEIDEQINQLLTLLEESAGGREQYHSGESSADISDRTV